MNTSAEINYKMVILARESRGLTQKELAEKLGVTQGKLSKFENGIQGVADDLIDNLSQVLNYPATFFYRIDNIYNLSQYHYRKKLTVSKRVLEKSEALVNISRINVERMLKSIDIPECNLPNFNVDSVNTPQEAAKFLREYWRVPKGRIDNLTKLIEDNGIMVLYFDFDSEKIDGLNIVMENNQPLIFINKNIPADRQRLTLAHELAHRILHPTGKYISPDRDVEKEAYDFAGEFMMPEREIRPSLMKLNLAALAELKLYWKVSMASLLTRAKRLSTLTTDQYKYLLIQMGRQGYRTREPNELDFPQEQSTLLREVIDAHMTELLYTREDMSNLLSLTEREFGEKFLETRPKLRVIR